jgi:ribonuclease R
LARRITGGGKSGAGRPAGPAAVKNKAAYRPTREELVRFIADNPDRSGRRDIAKAFGLKNDDRIWLKDTLRELEDEGLLESRRKRLSTPGSLPSMALLDIFSLDPDGALLARPAETEGQQNLAPTVVAVRASRGAKTPVAGVGDRVLARIFPSREKDGPAYTARVVRLIDKRRDAVLGVLRETAGSGFRIEPVERRQAELIIDREYLNGAKAGDLVEVEPSSSGRYGLKRGKVITVLGSLASEKAVSMIAIHAHGIPHIFPPEVLAEAEAAKPAAMKGREDWRSVPLVTIDPSDAKDHDDAVFAEPDPDEKNPGGVIATVAIADVASYVRAGSVLDQEAL